MKRFRIKEWHVPFIIAGCVALVYAVILVGLSGMDHKGGFIKRCAEHRPLVDCKVDDEELYP